MKQHLVLRTISVSTLLLGAASLALTITLTPRCHTLSLGPDCPPLLFWTGALAILFFIIGSFSAVGELYASLNRRR